VRAPASNSVDSLSGERGSASFFMMIFFNGALYCAFEATRIFGIGAVP